MLIPAIDLIDGQIVRLYQGDYDKVTYYALSPLDCVHRYADAGAKWLHIVDLSGAKSPDKRQTALIKAMVATGRMAFQAGGGIRNESDIQQLFAAGVDRVVIGSLAITAPERVASWLEKYGADRIVLALDINITEDGQRLVASHGWQTTNGVNIETLLTRFSPCGLKHVLCTDISKDGTLGGSNTALYRGLVKDYPQISWQASGGIGKAADLATLACSGVQSVIMGRALLEGQCPIDEAISTWEANRC